MMRHRMIEELLAVYRSLDADQRQLVDAHVASARPARRGWRPTRRWIDGSLTTLMIVWLADDADYLGYGEALHGRWRAGSGDTLGINDSGQ